MFSVKRILGVGMSVCAAASILCVSEAQAQDGKATVTAQDGSILSCDIINGMTTNCVPIEPAPAQVVAPADQQVNPAPVADPAADPADQQVYQQYPQPTVVVVQTPEPQREYQPIQNQPITPPEDHVAGRVLTDIGFNLLYNIVATGVGVGLILDGGKNDSLGEVWGGVIAMEIGFIINPALAVMTSHAIWGGDGSMGWTWGGTLLGWLGGIALGALCLTGDSDNALYYIGGTLTLIMPTVGAILGYELTNKSAREQKYRYSSSVTIYPAFEISPERKTIGVGLQF